MGVMYLGVPMYKTADGNGVASENGTRVVQVDGTGVQTKQNKWKNL